MRGVLAGGAGLAGYAFGVEPEWLELTRTEVPVNGLGKGLDGFKIGLISDLHYPHYVDAAFVQRAFRMLMAESPDVVCVPGDIYQMHTRVQDHPLRGVLDFVHAPHGVFGTMGNHDCNCDIPALLRTVQDQTPIRMLSNEARVISRGGDAFCLAGLPMLGFYPRIDLAKTFRGVEPGLPRVALCHHPDFAEKRGETERIDLLLSGHTHGGQVRLTPWYAPVTMSRYGSKFLGGLVDGTGFRVYVTRGLARPLHARLMSRPEVSVLTLRSSVPSL